MHNFPGHEAIINTLSVNEEGVLFSGGQYLRVRLDSMVRCLTRCAPYQRGQWIPVFLGL